MELMVDAHTVYVATGNKSFDSNLSSVIFVHGAGQDHTVWVLPTRYFARHQRNVLAVDLPGHGRSGGTPLTRIEDIAAWIMRVLDAAGIEQATVVGHSMGSLVAIAAAAHYPQRVRSIALIGTTVPMPVSDALLTSAKENSHNAIDMLTLWGYSSSAHVGGSATPGMWMLGGGMRLLERSKPGVIYADLNACNEYRNGLVDAAALNCHALLILGEKDNMTPSRSTAGLAAAIKNTSTVLLPNAGHALLSERPEQVLDALIGVV